MSRHLSSPRYREVAAAVLVLAIGIAGCSSKSSESSGDTGVTSPLLAPVPIVVRSSWLFYPPVIGRHWDWVIHVENRITTSTGTLPPDTTSQPWSAEIVDTVSAGTRLYFVQAEYDPRVNLTPPSTGFLRREDESGLYERDVAGVPNVAAGRASPADPSAGLMAFVDRAEGVADYKAAFAKAAAQVAQKIAAVRMGSGFRRFQQTGLDPGEFTMLSYPLMLRTRWIVRDSPRFVRTVTGREVIRVPLGRVAAWEIRQDAELFGPNDRVSFWFSSLGLVRLRYHVEADAVDSTAAVIGRVATDFDQSLAGARLEKPPTFPSLVTPGH